MRFALHITSTVLSFLMPCIIINDKYTEAILWSAHILAYMHIYTWKQAGSQLYSHTSASTETMAVVHTGPVNGPFHQSALQQDTNWAKKGKKTPNRQRVASVQAGFFHPRRCCWCDIFHYRRTSAERSDQGQRNMQPFTPVIFPWETLRVWEAHGGTNMARQFPEHQGWGCKGLESRCII